MKMHRSMHPAPTGVSAVYFRDVNIWPTLFTVKLIYTSCEYTTVP